MRTISKQEYERKVPHGYAGPGRPMDPKAPGVHWLELDATTGATVLVFGEIAEEGA